MDSINRKIGMLTIIDEKSIKKGEVYRIYCLCKCDCGNEKWIRKDTLKKGNQKSCGCMHKGNFYKDENLIGKKFGGLEIISDSNKIHKYGGTIWIVKCICGKIVEMTNSDLMIKKTCGCRSLQYDSALRNSKKGRKAIADKYIVENTNIALINRDRLFKHNTSGVTGVKYDKSRNKWQAEIHFKNKLYYLGRFDKKEDAIKARKEAEKRLHEDFLKWYSSKKVKRNDI